MVVLHHSTIQLLRFPFSFFLLPVYLFALSQVIDVQPITAGLVFFVLHLLVYPSSNGYNSYIDRDKSAIGGLKNPLQPTKQLYYVTILMDVLAIIISCFISLLFAAGIAVYIMASRLYSGPPVRLKRFPLTGFFVVFICQGALIYFLTYNALSTSYNLPLLPMVISSCLIGALYPLTQVYQHKEDSDNGITTLSILLGKRGTFVFSLLLFFTATLLLWVYFKQAMQLNHFYLFLLITVPVVLFFLTWMISVWKDEEKADFKHSLWMNMIATACTGIYFLTLSILKH